MCVCVSVFECAFLSVFALRKGWTAGVQPCVIIGISFCPKIAAVFHLITFALTCLIILVGSFWGVGSSCLFCSVCILAYFLWLTVGNMSFSEMKQLCLV